MESNTPSSIYKKGNQSAAGIRSQAGPTRLSDLGLGKLPPQAVDLEEALLGALMLEKEPLANVIELLRPATFYKEGHQLIFEAIQGLFQASQPVDLLTVNNFLKQNGTLDKAGGKGGAIQGIGWQLLTRTLEESEQDWKTFQTTFDLWKSINEDIKPKRTSYQIKHQKNG